MRFYHFLLIFNFCFSQATSLPIYGAGELIGNQDASAMGLGNGTFYSANKFGISLSSPSSLWRTPYTYFSIISGMNFLKIPTYSDQFQHNLAHFSALFPIGEYKAFGFGLKPTYRTNKIEIKQDFEFVGSDQSSTSFPIASQSNFFLDGGISDVFVQFSMKVNSNLSFGIQYSVLFGKQKIDERRYSYDIEIDSVQSSQASIYEFSHNEIIYYIYEGGGEITYINKVNKYLGSRALLEAKYINDDHEFTFRTSMDGKLLIDKTDMQNTLDSIYYNYYNFKRNSKISELALGYHYKKNNDLGAIIETKINFPLELPSSAALFKTNSPKEHSYHIGIYKRINNPKFSLWNNLNFRGGFYLKELNFHRNKFIDYGFTLGFGIEYLSNSQSIDIALRSGKRESLIIDDKYENYFSIYLSIMTGEKWFMKRRRK